MAIARALMQDPEIVLADEPIASLDPRNATRVLDALKAINREDGITVIVNLHHLDITWTPRGSIATGSSAWPSSAPYSPR